MRVDHLGQQGAERGGARRDARKDRAEKGNAGESGATGADTIAGNANGCAGDVGCRGSAAGRPGRARAKGLAGQSGVYGGRRIRKGAQPRNSESVLVSAEPVHPKIAAGVAVNLEDADVQHHLLRGRNFHRVDHRSVRGEAFGHFDRARGPDRVAGLAAEDDLAIGAGDIDVLAARRGHDIVVQRGGVGRHFEVDDREQMPLPVEHRNIGRADPLSLDVKRRVGHGQHVGDFRRADHGRRERTIDF